MSEELAELQKAFLAAMRAAADNAAANKIMSALAPGRYARPEIGLSIYQNAYGARLREVLENDHPQLGKYLGDELWRQLRDSYIDAQPSTVFSLRDFGASLPHFAATAEPFSSSPQIAELAAFERRLLDCFDAADAPMASWQSLLATAPERWPNVCPLFHPSVQLHRTKWNTIEIWRALKAEQTPPELCAAHTDWLLWRDREQLTRFRSLAADEAQAYLHFHAGGDFASLCEVLQERHPAERVPAIALGLLQGWCTEDVISAWGI